MGRMYGRNCHDHPDATDRHRRIGRPRQALQRLKRSTKTKETAPWTRSARQSPIPPHSNRTAPRRRIDPISTQRPKLRPANARRLNAPRRSSTAGRRRRIWNFSRRYTRRATHQTSKTPDPTSSLGERVSRDARRRGAPGNGCSRDAQPFDGVPDSALNTSVLHTQQQTVPCLDRTSPFGRNQDVELGTQPSRSIQPCACWRTLSGAVPP